MEDNNLPKDTSIYAKTYRNLKTAYGDDYAYTYEDFKKYITTDSEFVNKTYRNLKTAYGDDYTITPDEFTSLVKKKETSQPTSPLVLKSSEDTAQQSGILKSEFVPSQSNAKVQPEKQQYVDEINYDPFSGGVSPTIGGTPEYKTKKSQKELNDIFVKTKPIVDDYLDRMKPTIEASTNKDLAYSEIEKQLSKKYDKSVVQAAITDYQTNDIKEKAINIIKKGNLGKITYLPDNYVEEVKSYLRQEGYKDEAVETAIADIQRISKKQDLDISGLKQLKRQKTDEAILEEASNESINFFGDNEIEKMSLNKKLKDYYLKKNKTVEDWKAIRDTENKLKSLPNDLRVYRPIDILGDQPQQTQEQLTKEVQDRVDRYKTTPIGQLEQKYVEKYAGYVEAKKEFTKVENEVKAVDPYGSRKIEDQNLISRYKKARDVFDNAQMDYMALSKLYLLNEAPANVSKDFGYYVSDFAKNVVTSFASTVGMEDAAKKLPKTERDMLDATDRVMSAESIKKTDADAAKLERTLLETTTEATAGIIGVLPALMAANKVQGVLGITSLIGRLTASESILAKTLGHTIGIITEEAKMQAALDSETGVGAGFYIGAKAGFPIPLKGKWGAILKPYMDKLVTGSIGGTTGMELGEVSKTFADALLNDKDFNYRLKELYPSADEVQKRIISNLISNTLLGFTHLNKADYTTNPDVLYKMAEKAELKSSEYLKQGEKELSLQQQQIGTLLKEKADAIKKVNPEAKIDEDVISNMEEELGKPETESILKEVSSKQIQINKPESITDTQWNDVEYLSDYVTDLRNFQRGITYESEIKKITARIDQIGRETSEPRPTEQVTDKVNDIVKQEKPEPTKVNVFGKEMNTYNNFIPEKEQVESEALYSFTSNSKEGIPEILRDKAKLITKATTKINGKTVENETWTANITGEELNKLYETQTKPEVITTTKEEKVEEITKEEPIKPQENDSKYITGLRSVEQKGETTIEEKPEQKASTEKADADRNDKTLKTPEEVSNWSKEQKDIENDNSLSAEQKEKKKIESTTKALNVKTDNKQINSILNSHKPDNDVFRKWKVSGHKISYAGVGKKLTQEQATQIIENILKTEEFSNSNQNQFYYDKNTGVITYFGDTDLMINVNKKIGNNSIIKEKSIDDELFKIRENVNKKIEKEEIVNKNKKLSDSIDNVFGEDAMNIDNKVRLIKFIKGETKSFDGIVNSKWKKGAENADILNENKDGIDFGKLKKYFEKYVSSNKDVDVLVNKDAYVLSEAYHKAKEDGSNPELVKAVEELLSQKKDINATETKEVSPTQQKETFNNDIENNGKKIKGITVVDIKDDTITYGNNKTVTNIKIKSKEDAESELKFSKEQLDYEEKQLPKLIKGDEKIQNSLGYSLKEKNDSKKGIAEAKKNIEVLKNIVIPFYEKYLKETKSEKPSEGVSPAPVETGLAKSDIVKEPKETTESDIVFNSIKEKYITEDKVSNAIDKAISKIGDKAEKGFDIKKAFESFRTSIKNDKTLSFKQKEKVLKDFNEIASIKDEKKTTKQQIAKSSGLKKERDIVIDEMKALKDKLKYGEKRISDSKKLIKETIDRIIPKLKGIGITPAEMKKIVELADKTDAESIVKLEQYIANIVNKEIGTKSFIDKTLKNKRDIVIDEMTALKNQIKSGEKGARQAKQRIIEIIKERKKELNELGVKTTNLLTAIKRLKGDGESMANFLDNVISDKTYAKNISDAVSLQEDIKLALKKAKLTGDNHAKATLLRNLDVSELTKEHLTEFISTLQSAKLTSKIVNAVKINELFDKIKDYDEITPLDINKKLKEADLVELFDTENSIENNLLKYEEKRTSKEVETTDFDRLTYSMRFATKKANEILKKLSGAGFVKNETTNEIGRYENGEFIPEPKYDKLLKEYKKMSELASDANLMAEYLKEKGYEINGDILENVSKQQISELKTVISEKRKSAKESLNDDTYRTEISKNTAKEVLDISDKVIDMMDAPTLVQLKDVINNLQVGNIDANTFDIINKSKAISQTIKMKPMFDALLTKLSKGGEWAKKTTEEIIDLLSVRSVSQFDERLATYMSKIIEKADKDNIDISDKKNFDNVLNFVLFKDKARSEQGLFSLLYEPYVKALSQSQHFILEYQSALKDRGIGKIGAIKKLMKGDFENFLSESGFSRKDISIVMVALRERDYYDNDIIKGTHQKELSALIEKGKKLDPDTYSDEAFTNMATYHILDSEKFGKSKVLSGRKTASPQGKTNRLNDLSDAAIHLIEKNNGGLGNIKTDAEMKALLTPTQRRLFDFARNFTLKNRDKAEMVAAMNGVEFSQRDSYMTLKNVAKEEITDYISYVDKEFFEAPSLLSGNVIARQEFGVKPYDSNVLKVLGDYTESMARNLYVKPAVRQMNYAVDMLKKQYLGTEKEQAVITLTDAVSRDFKNRIVIEFAKPELNKWYESMLNKSSLILLAKAIRPANEITSNIFQHPYLTSRVILDSITSGKIISKIESYSELAKNNGSSVFTRDADMGKWADLKKQEATTKSGTWVSDYMGEVLKRVVSMGDSFVKPMLWTSVFDSNFKLQTGQDFSIEKYKSDPTYRKKYQYEIFESIKEAEVFKAREYMDDFKSLNSYRVEIPKKPRISLKNKSVQLTTTIDRYAGTGKSLTWLAGYPMKQGQRYIDATRLLLTGSKKDKIRAIHTMGSITMQNVMYTAAFQVTSNLMAALLAKTAGDDEKAKAAIKDIANVSSGRFWAETLTGAILGGYINKWGAIGKIGIGALASYYKYNKYDTKGMTESEKKEIKEKAANFTESFQNMSGVRPLQWYGGTKSDAYRSMVQNIPRVGYVTDATVGVVLDIIETEKRKTALEEKLEKAKSTKYKEDLNKKLKSLDDISDGQKTILVTSILNLSTFNNPVVPIDFIRYIEAQIRKEQSELKNKK